MLGGHANNKDSESILQELRDGESRHTTNTPDWDP